MRLTPSGSSRPFVTCLVVTGFAGALAACSPASGEPSDPATSSMTDASSSDGPSLPTPGMAPSSVDPGNGSTPVPGQSDAPNPPLPGTGGAPAVGPEGSAGSPAGPVGGQPPTGVGGTTPGAGGVDMGVGGLLGVAGISAGGVGTGGNMNPPQSVVPTVSGTEYSLVLPSATLVADGPTGRITQLVVSGTNRLTTAAVNPLNYGSSFWTSPQSVWGWPPPLDAVTQDVLRTDYAHSIDGDAILLSTGPTTQGSESVSVSKRLSADAARDVLVLDYTITNTGTAAISVAPWEITRMVAQGFTLYPTGTSAMAPQIPTSAIDGVTWLDYAAAGISPQTKNIADGAEGWLAHVDGGVLFLKVFADSAATAAAPAEGEIELYIDSLSTYVELEQQGAYGSLSAGASSAPWQVLWVVRAVPAEVDVSLGSPTLVAWIRDIVAGL